LIQAAYSNPAIEYVSWMGEIFMRAFKDANYTINSFIINFRNYKYWLWGKSGQTWRENLTILHKHKFFAILTGQILVNIIKPGVGAQINFVQQVEGLIENNDLLERY